MGRYRWQDPFVPDPWAWHLLVAVLAVAVLAVVLS